MIAKLLYDYSANLPYRLIYTENQPYLERYYLREQIYLHRFVNCDGDRSVHCRPWRWGFSIILCGGYEEKVMRGIDIHNFGGLDCVVKKRKFFNLVGRNKFHQIQKIEPNTWTLFAHSSKLYREGWGFFQELTWGSFLFKPMRASRGSLRFSLPLGKNAPREPFGSH